MKSFNFVGLILALSLTACAPATFKPEVIASQSSLALLPNWYHERLGYQLMGDNFYPENRTLASLLKKADLAFQKMDLQGCQIFLERAQRIATRAPGVYVRLSYLFWVLDQSAQAEQMARRALAVMGDNELAKLEVKRLLAGIRKSRY